MFGYVKICEDELLVRNHKKYKNTYCALCKQIGCYSQVSRLLLSYDMVFCVLLSGAHIPQNNLKCRHKTIKRCKKCHMSEELRYWAAVSIILQYHKLYDDVIDGKRSRRFLIYAIENGYKKAKNDYPDIDKIIKETMNRLQELEKKNCTDWNVLDSCFPDIMLNTFLCSTHPDEFTSIKGQIAKHVASWVYWFDMLQDLDEDRKDNNYNILLYLPEAETKEKIHQLLIDHLCAAEKLCNLLPFSDEVSIIQNIIGLGIPNQMKEAGISL